MDIDNSHVDLNHVLDCKPWRAGILSPSTVPGMMLVLQVKLDLRMYGGDGETVTRIC